MADTQTTSAMPLATLLATAWRRRWTALSVAAAVLFLVVLLSLTQTPLYKAEALLVVDRGGKQLAFLPEDADAKGAEFSLLNTQSELLQSNEVIGQVLVREEARFKDSPVYARSNDPRSILLDRLKVGTNQYNWIIHLSLTDEDPERARAALDSLIQCHLANERRRLEDRSRNALDFLEQAVVKARVDLDRCREAETDFRRENGILSIDPDRNLLTLQLEALDTARTGVLAELAASDAVLQGLGAADGVAPDAGALLRVPEVLRDPLVAQQRQVLFDAQRRALSLAQKFKPAHPQMVDAAHDVESAQARLAEVAAAAHAGILDAHRGLVRRQEQLDQHIARVKVQLADYSEKLIRLQVLSGKTASAEQLFQTLDRNLHEERITSHRQAQAVTIADPPHVASSPVAIRRSLFLLAGTVLGAMAGIATALVVDALDRRIRNPQAVRQITNLPTLGYIPHVEGLGLPDKPGAPPAPQHVMIDEAFRLLSSTIQLSCDADQGARVLVVTSPGSGDGRTTVAARLAATMAASGSYVLLIDGDLRQPGLHRQFSLPEEPGVSDLLEGREAVVVSTGFPRLELLSAGHAADKPLELPNIRAFREMVSTFAGHNRFIIIDSPPLEFSEALVMTGVANDVLVVVRDQYTSKEALRLAQIRLGPLLNKVLGLVINDDREVSSFSRGTGSRVAQTGVYQRRRSQVAEEPGKPADIPSANGSSGRSEVVVIDES